jgi:hypothetical protein
MISDTAPTNVVLPTPKPPATTIFVEVRPGLEPAKSTEHPFEQINVGPAGVQLWLVYADQAFGRHVGDQHAYHAERDPQQGRHLRDGPDLPAQ